MFNAHELAQCLALGQAQYRAGLTVVPTPNLDTLRSRGATSIDLRLGRWFKSFKQTRVESVSLAPTSPDPSSNQRDGSSRTRQHFVPFRDRFVLHPGRFVLGATLEWLRLPSTMSGYVTGMSSLGRHGLIIETAAGIHPGFSGCLTLELANIGEVPLSIYPGMQICQVFFHRIEGHISEDPGSFSGTRKPMLQPPKVDPTFERLRT